MRYYSNFIFPFSNSSEKHVSRKSRKSISISEKIRLIKDYTVSTKTQEEFSSENHISRTTLCTILKNKEKIISYSEKIPKNSKRMKMSKPKYEKLEQQTLYWFVYVRNNNLPINDYTIQSFMFQKAIQLNIENFKASNGFLHNFKKRHNVIFKNISGESAGVSMEAFNDWKMKLKDIIVDYDDDHIYNLDESALFYRATQSKTLDFIGSDTKGMKIPKDRYTFLLCTNMSGNDKMEMLVIGKSANPRCFKGVNDLHVHYYSNKSAWMTMTIFQDYLIKLDQHFRSCNKKILLFMDNCSSHMKIPNLEFIKIQYFPPNMTSVAQPLDQGIINSLKVSYRKEYTRRLIDAIEISPAIKKLNIYESIKMLVEAWDRMDSQVIFNCFRHAHFKRDSDTISNETILSVNPDLDNLEISRIEQLINDSNEFNDINEIEDYTLTSEIIEEPEVLESLYSNIDDSNISIQDDPVVPEKIFEALKQLEYFVSKVDNRSKVVTNSVERMKKFVVDNFNIYKSKINL